MTSRRGFLSALLGLSAGAALDPERLLWVPGAKLISISAVKPISFYSVYFQRELRHLLQNQFTFAQVINRQYENWPKEGTSLIVPTPPIRGRGSLVDGRPVARIAKVSFGTEWRMPKWTA